MIKIDQWFPTPIVCDTTFDIDVLALEKFCLNLKNTTPGRTSTNYGGWQSEDLNYSIPELEPLKEKIIQLSVLMHKEFKLKKSFKPVLDNIWVNINPKGGFNIPHIHGESIFSGVFYVKAKEGNGKINFAHPAPNILYHLPELIIDQWSNSNSSNVFHYPQPGKMIMFPSWISHYVEPNLLDQDRISIAFNLKLEYSESV